MRIQHNVGIVHRLQATVQSVRDLGSRCPHVCVGSGTTRLQCSPLPKTTLSVMLSLVQSVTCRNSLFLNVALVYLDTVYYIKKINITLLFMVSKNYSCTNNRALVMHIDKWRRDN